MSHTGSGHELNKIVEQLMQPGKGILAADESLQSAGKRLAAVGLSSTPESRRRYRELFFTPVGIEKYLSGVILFDETIYQSTRSGKLFRELLRERGIEVGIKVDQGTVALSESSREVVTEGLVGLNERLVVYKNLGASFAKWRAVIRIGEDLPTRQCLKLNASRMAEYAQVTQDAGLIPIVEPEVLMEGQHVLAQSRAVIERTLQTVFAELKSRRVRLSNLILKTSMVVPGASAMENVAVQEVASATVECLIRVVPPTVGGVVFLSGGQPSELATERLSQITRQGPFPWPVTFSFARALQQPALEIWRGMDEKFAEAQTAFLERLHANAAAVSQHRKN